ncbi:MAG: M23 family metallopeptidase [Candidatus Neomarinimicrobiota bacterium]
MGYLKSIWRRQYQLVVMSADGGWSRSYIFVAGRLLLIVLGAVLVTLGMVVVIALTLPRLADHRRVLTEKELLEAYREKVRRIVMEANRYGLLGAELLEELELSTAIAGDLDSTAGPVQTRRGGIAVDGRHISFLDNLPTFPPVNGFVTRGQLLHALDMRVNHPGVDIAAPEGEIIHAAASGLVIFSHWTEDLGYLIILSHGGGYFSIYGHNQINLVQPRDWVERGQPIGLVGNTGISQGPHLHFEIWKEARSIDPRLFIEIYRKQDVSVDIDG